MASCIILLALAAGTSASVLWDGRLNNYSDISFLADWSWSNQVGPYQYYIHGSGGVSDYVALAAEYKNPDDISSERGVQITIDDSSSWNGQNMMRTELIPSTTAPINAGKVFYHFSIQHSEINPPTQTEEHQICFFESHFTELKYGLLSGASSNILRWMANGETQWNVTLEAGQWHNIAYGIDFDAQTVTFYHSTGADALTLTAGPVSATTFSDGADWHLGVLRLPGSSGPSGAAESWAFSGVYIENGDLTTTIGGSAGGSEQGPAAMAPTSAASPATSSVAAAKISSSSTVATTLQTLIKPPSTSVSVTSVTTTTSSATETTASSNCPAAGMTDDEGHYSCNPAHQYPSGQTCDLVGSCYVLVSHASTIPSATTAAAAAASDVSSDVVDAEPTAAFPEGYTLEDLQSLVTYLQEKGWSAEEA